MRIESLQHGWKPIGQRRIGSHALVHVQRGSPGRDLPSYLPNLNLIERLWKFVKKECLGCRVLPTYDAFTTAIDDCLANLNTRHKHQMKTLLNLEFQLFDEDVPVLAA